MFSLEINIKSQEHGGRTREQRVMLTAEVSESSVISRRTDEEVSNTCLMSLIMNSHEL